jgi:hypothetical protein
MKLNQRAFALSAGIIWGVSVFVATIWLVIIGSAGTTIALLHKFYLGYSVSFVGAFIGLIWGFIDGLIIGFIFAWIYNLFTPKVV